ncbi:DUF4062 domain-containing protein [Methylocaldum sp. BRCS4]|nr:DUF4062 domain-containing protein [Methylocaldum sp. BRCS4]
MAKVYVSSTFLDLKAERQAVMNWLITAGHQPVHSYAPDTETVHESCLDDVDGCDIYVLILGYRYGHQPKADNPENLSITHLEYRRAKAKWIPTIVLLRTSIPDVALSDWNDPDKQERIKAFRDEVSRDRRPGEFSDEAGLISALSTGIGRALDVLRNPTPATDELHSLFRRASSDLLTWQVSLSNGQWLERPELNALMQHIEGDTHSLTLLLGEPGCGKSALLARLGQQLEAASIPVLGIKLDFLPETVQDQNGLKEYLGLPVAIVDCVRTLARAGKVVVLVDQLDALADLVVQHSGRLRVPLELIRDLAGLDNVHVVASCRVFEHRHDPRLRNLEAEPMTLAQPAWEQVDAALQAYGVRTAAWNESMREDLRSPHALDTFLRLLKTTEETDLLQGYQHMLESLWKQAVLCDTSGIRHRLLLDLTERMADREVLWLPLAAFENRYAVILELEAAGVLIEETGRIGFRHQTLFEFVRARIFLEAGGRLTDTVLSRQDSLRIRPQIWHALGYMRAVDRHAYLAEIRRLWAAELRPHLRMLLIEFLGQLQDPEPAEAALFFQNFDDAWYRGRILAAVIGSRGWFARLSPAHLPMLMVRSAQEAWPMVSILVEALHFDQPTVLKLIDEHWLLHTDKDGLTWRVLERVTEWKTNIVDRCCRILLRTDVAAWTVNHLAGIISMQLPEQAPRLIATWFKREWEKEFPPEPHVEAQEAESETLFQDRLHESPRSKRCRKLLEEQQLHDLPALAEAAPGAFLDAIWPWFVQVLATTTQEAHPFVVGYRQDYSLIGDIDDEREIRIEQPFLTAMVQAVEKLADCQPEAFLSFAKANDEIDLMIVQRLLAKGMVHIVATCPHVALDFLGSDPRRLVLGSHSDVHRNTKDLIHALTPHLDTEQFQRLEQAIQGWNRYSHVPDEDAETRRNRMLWTREHRLRLLKTLPRERMSAGCRRHVEEDERAFPELRDYDMWFSGFREIGCRVSAKQMECAQDKDVLNLFSELTDEHGWNHPKKWMEGGAIQAGRELAKLAEKEPERAVRLIRQMPPGQNEIPVGDVLEALAKTSFDRNDLYGLILELAEKGFASEHFRRPVAWAMEKAVDADHPLPEPLFDIMESWLAPAAESSGEACETREENEKAQGSLLWDSGGIAILPTGNYPVLAALSVACLRAQPPRTDRWLNILERHLPRPESPRVWVAMFRYLQWLHLADRNHAQVFLDRLFLTYPSVLDTLEGARLLAHCQCWIEPDVAQHWLGRMLKDGGETAAQGMGELLMLRRAWFPDECWIAERLNDLIHADERDEKQCAARVGIAHSIAHLWQEPQHRYTVHSYLLQLLKDQDERVLKALAGIFRLGGFLPDRASRELLDTLCEYPPILRHQSAEFVGECLEELVHIEPERIYKICNILLDLAGMDMGNIASSRYLMSESLVTIALALQDLGAPHQAQGTALFERMLEFNVLQAREILLDLDKRTPQQTSATSVRRRKWRRTKKH